MFFNQIKYILRHMMPSCDCYLCQSSIEASTASVDLICEDCHQDLAHLANCCDVCSQPLTTNQSLTCGQCLQHTPLFTRTVAAYHYEPPISDFITQLKFNGKREALSFMCDDLHKRIKLSYRQQALPQLLIPVPLHPRKLRQRGFNQANLIAKRLAKSLSVKVNNRIASRVRNTSPQVDLDATQRIKNLRGAFAISPSPIAHVAIIDDVMTTGTTVSELAQSLIRSGTKRVDVWCLARAYAN